MENSGATLFFANPFWPTWEEQMVVSKHIQERCDKIHPEKPKGEISIHDACNDSIFQYAQAIFKFYPCSSNGNQYLASKFIHQMNVYLPIQENQVTGVKELILHPQQGNPFKLKSLFLDTVIVQSLTLKFIQPKLKLSQEYQEKYFRKNGMMYKGIELKSEDDWEEVGSLQTTFSMNESENEMTSFDHHPSEERCFNVERNDKGELFVVFPIKQEESQIFPNGSIKISEKMISLEGNGIIQQKNSAYLNSTCIVAERYLITQEANTTAPIEPF